MVAIFSKVYSGIISTISNPFGALITLLIVLFFPLNLLDYLIIVIVNAGIAILNAILWILIIIVNGIVWILNSLIGGICDALSGVFEGLECPVDMPYMEYLTQDWLTESSVNLFGETATVFGIILSLIGLEFPVW